MIAKYVIAIFVVAGVFVFAPAVTIWLWVEEIKAIRRESRKARRH